MGNPSRGRQRLRTYVLEEWLPNHQMEARTRESYTYYLDGRILPWFGHMRMIEVMPADVRAWITHLKNENVSPHVIRYCMTILSAVFTTAFNDVIHLHPVRGIKPPPIPKKKRAIITPEQFDQLYLAVCSDTMKLLVEADVESGMRWGELTELRPRDLDFRTGVVTVSRVAVELPRRFHPEGGRFLIKDYPKDGEHRQFKLSQQIVRKIEQHIAEHGIGPDDLLFTMPELPPRPVRLVADRATLGLTTPNAAGRRYQHGTLSGYTAGKRRCEHCRGAYASYRARRRAGGQDQPRGHRTVETDGHIPRWWFRTHVWLPAVEAADLPITVKVHGLRHAHASCQFRGSGHRSRQRATRPRQHRHDAKVPWHPRRDRRNRDRCPEPDPQPQPDRRCPPCEEVGVNPRTRRVALYALAAIAILASANALAQLREPVRLGGPSLARRVAGDVVAGRDRCVPGGGGAGSLRRLP